MRAHLATGPVAHRAAVTLFVPRGHPAHRQDAGRARAAPGSREQLLPVRGGLPAALAAAVCALAVLGAALLGAAPGGRLSHTSPVPPWHAAAPTAPLAGTAAQLAVPGIRVPGLPALAAPAAVLPVPHFIGLPFRGR